MYGAATDVFVDNDRNGWTDDVNRDGRVDIRAAEVLARAAERAEARHPALVWAASASIPPAPATGPSSTWTCAGGGPAGGGPGADEVAAPAVPLTSA